MSECERPTARPQRSQRSPRAALTGARLTAPSRPVLPRAVLACFAAAVGNPGLRLLRWDPELEAAPGGAAAGLGSCLRAWRPDTPQSCCGTPLVLHTAVLLMERAFTSVHFVLGCNYLMFAGMRFKNPFEWRSKCFRVSM